MFPTSFEHDIAKKPMLSSDRKAVEVSLPHILQISFATYIPGAGLTNNLELISLFNAFAVLNTSATFNYGNNIFFVYDTGGILIGVTNATISYLSGGPAGAPFTYTNLLSSTLTVPFSVGVTRIVSVTQAQALQPMNILRNVGIGKFIGKTKFPLVFPDQYQKTITYIQEPYKIDGFTLLNYVQNYATDFSILIYFYGESNVDTARAFSNQKVVQEYGAPQTGIIQDANVSSGVISAKIPPQLARSSSLL